MHTLKEVHSSIYKNVQEPQEHINRIKTRFIIFKQPQSNLKATSKHVHIRKKHNYNYSIPYFAVLLTKKKEISTTITTGSVTGFQTFFHMVL